MKRTKQGGSRAGRGAAAAAVVAMAALPMGEAGCNDNRLPPNPVPRPDEQAALPRWYPEAPWSASNGDSRILIDGKIVFDTGKATIHPSSERVLNTLLQFAREHDEVTLLRIEGHTDYIASDEYNNALSARRALAVCDWLVDHDVDNTRLVAVGFGKTRPIAPNERADGRQENRRTEFHVAEVNGRPFPYKDPAAGGWALTVKSKEERIHDAQAVAQRRLPPAPKPFVATGDVVREFTPPRSEKPSEAPATPAPSSPPPAPPAAPAGSGPQPGN